MIDAPIAIVREYRDLIAAARVRMAQLDITFETLDTVSGVQAGYSAKLLGPEPSKGLGKMSFGAIMGALGIKLAVVEDAEALARVRDRLVKRRNARPREGKQYRLRT